jgi:D-arabinose 1-dehydrogenase-like Zn-dependent alcohol dehydrogenase
MLTVSGSAGPAGTSSLPLAAIPDELPAEEARPFMCAGVTVYK